MKEILTWFSILWWLKTEMRFERDFYMIFHYKESQNFIAEHYEIYFDMIFHYKEAQNLLQSTMQEIFFTWYSNLRRRKFSCRALWKRYWNYLYSKAAENVVAGHYDRDFEIIFFFKAAEKVIAERYEKDFDMLFQF